MSKKLMLILNPTAGNGSGVLSIGSAMEVLYRAGFVPTVYYTCGVGEATQLVLEHAMDYECVVCVGGDGTLSETVAGLAQLESPPPLGYIPQGTANDVAASLGLPKNPLQAAKLIARAETMKLDVGKFNDCDYFTYIAAFGAFTTFLNAIIPTVMPPAINSRMDPTTMAMMRPVRRFLAGGVVAKPAVWP